MGVLRMIDNNKCILAYGLSEDELQSLNELNYKVIEIRPEMIKMTVKDVLDGLRFEIINNNPIKEKVIIYNNFPEIKLRETIALTRERIQGGILAMVTPNSINWTFEYLISHLIEEREWHLKNRKE